MSNAERTHGEAVATERRLVTMEMQIRSVSDRVTELALNQSQARLREHEREKRLSSIGTVMKRLASELDGMKSDQRRFIVGALLALGAVLWQIVRARIGL